MSLLRRFAILISLIVLSAVLIVPASAVITDVTGGAVAVSQSEGASVQYTVKVSGIPAQAASIELTTDLLDIGDEAAVWTLGSDSVKIVSGTENSQTIRVAAAADGGALPDSFQVTVTGRVPVLTSVETVEGVVVTKRVTKTTGYVYYHVKALDANGAVVGTASTETFRVTIPGEEQFLVRLNAVSDADFRNLVDSLYDKGLSDEANDLLKYYEAPKESSMSTMTAVIIGIVMLIIGFAIGMVLGGIRARNQQDYQSEY